MANHLIYKWRALMAVPHNTTSLVALWVGPLCNAKVMKVFKEEGTKDLGLLFESPMF